MLELERAGTPNERLDALRLPVIAVRRAALWSSRRVIASRSPSALTPVTDAIPGPVTVSSSQRAPQDSHRQHTDAPVPGPVRGRWAAWGSRLGRCEASGCVKTRVAPRPAPGSRGGRSGSGRLRCERPPRGRAAPSLRSSRRGVPTTSARKRRLDPHSAHNSGTHPSENRASARVRAHRGIHAGRLR
jgi:hypothetical protein